MKPQNIIGLDIGGTKTAVVFGTSSGEVLGRTEFPTRSERGFSSCYEDLQIAISEEMRKANDHVSAVSVSIGGPLDVLEGVIKSPPHLPGWDDIPLKKLLRDSFELPVYVEHDGNAGALAEFYFGAGKGCRSIVFLTLGTGFGAGLILDGRLYRGTTYVAGEIGHVRAAEEGPDMYGKRGAFEGFCSGAGIEKLAAHMFPMKWSKGISARELANMVEAGDGDAKKVFEESGKYLGRAFALLADIVNPEKIILGTLGLKLGQLLIAPAMEEFRKEALPQSFGACEIVPSQLGARIGDVASLCAAIDQGGLR